MRLRSPPCIGSVRQHGGAELEVALRRRRVARAGLDRPEDLLQLGAEEDRDDRRRRLVGPEPVVLARRARPTPAAAAGACRPPACTAAQKNRNCRFSCGVSPGSSRLRARVGAHRPVVVLARAVDAGERLLVQEADEPVAARHVLHHLHRQLLVVAADVRVLEHRRDLVLRRRDLVVARLDRHAELGQLLLGLEHAREHALGDRAEVVVVELVALRRLGAEQRAAGRDQVGALEVEALVDQEVLLLGADRREHARGGRCRRTASARAARVAGQRVHRAQQRDLVVERLAGPRGERGRDAERRAVRVLEDERRATSGPTPCSRAPRTSPGCRRSGTTTRRARPGSAPCRRTRRSRCRRRSGRRTSRASRPSMPVSGWNQCVKCVAPRSIAHSFMAVATASASAASSISPDSSVSCSWR